ncbi:MAG TPA: discoidin domain-containing protein [Patescibacteria group bacterium]|nr:discoidin domain-containing protein [Patescibacteria group bacterium]
MKKIIFYLVLFLTFLSLIAVSHVYAATSNKITGITATASNTYPTTTVNNAVDGDPSTPWNAGLRAPPDQWIQLDLQRNYNLDKIDLTIDQTPSGRTVHQIYTGPTPSTLTLVKAFDQVTSKGQVLTASFPTSIPNVRYIKINTTVDPSWVAWYEISVWGHESSGLGDATIIGNGATVTTKASFAGGITSLQYQNFEYIFQQIYQGAFIQYAWQNGNHGECANPTEQGAKCDTEGKTTSILQNFTSTNTSITKTVLPAYWLSPVATNSYCHTSPSCNFELATHTGTAVNTTAVSNSSLETTYTLDPENLPHALGLTGTITFGSTDTAPGLPFVMQGPAHFFDTTFTKSYRYNYGNGALLPPTIGNYWNTTLPPVLATADGVHAVGVYSAGVPRTILASLPQTSPSNNIVGYTLDQLTSPKGVWMVVIRLPYLPPGNASAITPGMKLSVRSYVVFGTLSEVTAQLHTLYLAHPPIANDCLGIAWEGKYEATDCPHSGNQTPAPSSTVKIGDLNNDGKVDILDYNILVSSFGKTGSPGFIPADIDKNGVVDIFDYNILLQQAGK